ncbi:MAG: hypothetical protein JKP90_15605 [Desulfofustis sp. PB-SRB1]|nr:hypothetical protein [Desulfofustis sp. PB-SRB1]
MEQLLTVVPIKPLQTSAASMSSLASTAPFVKVIVSFVLILVGIRAGAGLVVPGLLFMACGFALCGLLQMIS